MTKEEIKKLNCQDLADNIKYSSIWGKDDEKEMLLKQLGIVLRSIENNIYWATTDSGYSEEQKKAIIDVERERLLDMAYIFDPDGE